MMSTSFEIVIPVIGLQNLNGSADVVMVDKSILIRSRGSIIAFEWFVVRMVTMLRVRTEIRKIERVKVK